MSATASLTLTATAEAPGMLGAADPLMIPEKPAEPDPVEEELRAPMKAAGPVPGSIGSAVSVPAETANANATNAGATGATGVAGTAGAAGASASSMGAGAPNMGANMNAQPSPQNVAFNDPAVDVAANAATNAATKGGKPKMTKQTLILLCVVAGMVVLVLAIVLIMMLNGML